ncbi:nucleotide pyrophosphohydrolase [Exilibacterium tricleocarpae]|uniref:Nucleotide pyrophosphohydrolase n=1 Tax=Exilibacterium tricleocarpae TaxID=2591008 RepID=A0A545TLZ3_9GAMM|nr:nucleotide pyrophosphohydrolase [Exilibacterium tricleocarpae]TQV78252.1 nucleotide pyrophosphohydrolase [Exilibacterium tricleocarpae]
MDLEQLTREFEQIARANDWQALHSAKNLATAVSVEAAELLAEFQWLDDRQSDAIATAGEAKQRVGEEVADVLLYLVALCKRLDLDLADVVEEKMRKNRQRFLSKGH